MKNNQWLETIKKYPTQYLNRDLVLTLKMQQAIYSKYSSKIFYKTSKRVFDFSLSCVLLIASLPLFIVIAFLIKAGSRGPVFFRQKRVGKNFSIFCIYKFRTMQQESETVLPENVLPLEKLKNDLRTTKVGFFLRKWKLDELPQLINVVRGEMSLVGPRPLTLDDSVFCHAKYYFKFANKPGMTGLWQAFRENSIHFKLKFKLDAYYVKNASLLLDLKILFYTFFRVIGGEKILSRENKDC